jgi:hypothetical protein
MSLPAERSETASATDTGGLPFYIETEYDETTPQVELPFGEWAE